MPLRAGDVVGAKDDSGHFLAEKISDELLLGAIAVKVNFMISRRIVVHDFRRDLIFRSASHHNFIDPHDRIIVTPASAVQRCLNPCGLQRRYFTS